MNEEKLLNEGFRKYTGAAIDVYFKLEICQKSGNCVKGNNKVFDTNRKPWILANNATSMEVKRVIETCPSGALQYVVKENKMFNFEDGKFYLAEDGQIKAEITYAKAGNDILIIDHTFVDESLRGKGIGRRLVESVVRLAIDENKKIIPLCPYALKLFEEEEALQGIRY